MTSLDVYAGARPVRTTAVADGATEASFPAPAAGSAIRLEGFSGNDLAAALQLIV
ncbi:MAG TPA: hypothetical protein VGX25_23975 [Actinophytocola sp.]|uniref:hypothetical protein n=1 Tax=Actinophytocola sp. TaxID=1872138 RepID=UPI002DDC8FD8|nr:hypothetical protein [Actinophytocola sp.]HEV2782463.1 hypothetical protein [Actinophytocola sp.]